jgi:HemY protein
MRFVVWIVLLAAAAALAAAVFGANEGIVTFYRGVWRLDMSLNLFLILAFGVCLLMVTLMQGVRSLVGLPERARQWRTSRRERVAQAALREALAQYFAGRYSRAVRSAQRALSIQASTQDWAVEDEFTTLARLLGAGSAHRLQDRRLRDEFVSPVFQRADRGSAARAAEEGARMLAAEWALDDRDAERALEHLSALPAGVARRTQALRLRLQASRQGREPWEALKTARLLAKHGGIAPVAAAELLRSLAFEVLDGARDADQLRRVWAQFELADRKDAFVAARAAQRMAGMGQMEDARLWLRPFWERMDELSDDERQALALALVDCLDGMGPDWLPRLEAWAQSAPREPWIAYAVGCALAQRQLWGKARVLLELAVQNQRLIPDARRSAWVRLADMARDQEDEARAQRCFEAAARIQD